MAKSNEPSLNFPQNQIFFAKLNDTFKNIIKIHFLQKELLIVEKIQKD